MRIAIVTRIFAPEPSAASYRLESLAKGFAQANVTVDVVTVQPPKVLRYRANELARSTDGYQVSRFPVLRDKQEYVRGYVQYLSFDVPMFFRVLFGPRYSAIVVEPPPTTLFFAHVAAKLRRIPLFVYAGDVWSDASESAGAVGFVVKAVRAMERAAWSAAKGVFAVNSGVSNRVREIAPDAEVKVVGNGIDTDIFTQEGPRTLEGVDFTRLKPYALYAGTASEWQGAEVFVRALKVLRNRGIQLGIVFLGQGTSLEKIEALAGELEVHIELHGTVPPEQAAIWQRNAAMSLASIHPGAGYDFAYPTKIFAAWGCGTPVVYAGPGPARTTLAVHPALGYGVDYDENLVADAMQELLDLESKNNEVITNWAHENVSLQSVATRAIEFTMSQLQVVYSNPDEERLA